MTANILTDQGEFALMVASRRTGETLCYWAEQDRTLTVLFDEDPLPSWHQYRFSQDIIPGANIILTGQAHMSDKLIAGIVIYGGLEHVLTYFYAAQWTTHYHQLAKRYNTAKTRKDAHFLWKLYANFILTQGDDGGDLPREQMEIAKQYYRAFGAIIEQKLIQCEATVHVPLIVDSPGMAYVIN